MWFSGYMLRYSLSQSSFCTLFQLVENCGYLPREEGITFQASPKNIVPVVRASLWRRMQLSALKLRAAGAQVCPTINGTSNIFYSYFSLFQRAISVTSLRSASNPHHIVWIFYLNRKSTLSNIYQVNECWVLYEIQNFSFMYIQQILNMISGSWNLGSIPGYYR